jgi:hypothetical protein
VSDREHVTDEIGSEGGSDGDVERRDEDATARGSEASSTVDRVERDHRDAPRPQYAAYVTRDETGTTGRRSPTGPEQD